MQPTLSPLEAARATMQTIIVLFAICCKGSVPHSSFLIVKQTLPTLYATQSTLSKAQSFLGGRIPPERNLLGSGVPISYSVQRGVKTPCFSVHLQVSLRAMPAATHAPPHAMAISYVFPKQLQLPRLMHENYAPHGAGSLRT